MAAQTERGEALALRPYRDGDERSLVSLFADVFGKAISEDHWRWKLKGQRSPVENVWVGAANERIVFQWAAIPARFDAYGEPIPSMVAVDAMTHPDFRRRGLLSRGSTEAHAAWRNAGVAFVLGLPNEQYGSRKAAIGWQPLFRLQQLRLPLLPHVVLARRFGNPIFRHARGISTLWNGFARLRLKRDPSVEISRVDTVGEEFDRLWEMCRSEARLSCVRDRAWVDWRFLKCPTRTYRVLLARRGKVASGYLAYRIVHSEEKVFAQLLDMLVPRSDPASRDTLMHALLDDISLAKAESLETFALPSTSLLRFFRGLGFLRRHSFFVHMIPLSTRVPLELLRDPKQWRLTGADFDLA